MLDIGTPARIDITDVHGRTWTVSGAGVGAEGVELAEDPQGLFDEAPISGIWQQSAFQEGSTYLGHTIEPIDLVLGFDIYGDTGDWETIESRFYSGFAPDTPATIMVTTNSECRTLDVVKLKESKTQSKKDPRLLHHSKLILNLRAPFPFWKGDTHVAAFKATPGSTSGTLTVHNPTDRPLWLQWAMTAPGQWTIPDYDFADPTGRDGRRTITTPQLRPGEDLTIDTYPRHERYVAANGSNIAGRFAGVDFLYPLPPHTPPTVVPVSAALTGGTESSIQCRMVEYWTRPWGGRRL